MIENFVDWFNASEVKILRVTVGLFVLAKCIEGITMFIEWIL